MLVKMSAFLSRAESLVREFEFLKGEVFSVSTVNAMFRILPPKIIDKIVRRETEAESIDKPRGCANSMKTFKIIQEILEEEIELEIIASPYYEAHAESYRRHNGQTLDELFELAADSSQVSDEDVSHNKTSEERLEARVIRNLRNHRYRISRNVRLGKNVDEMIKRYQSLGGFWLKMKAVCQIVPSRGF